MVEEKWKLVPVEPTEEMLSAIWSLKHSNNQEITRQLYDAMLAASPAPALPESGVNLRIEFHQHDWIPGFAAFAPDATSPGPESKAFCVLNLGSLLAAVEDEEVAKAEVPYLVAETMMHEVMHALEQWAGTEFSEDRIETILHKYRSATPAPTPAPAPAPVDAAGLVARLSAKAQALYQTRSAEDHAGWEAGGALWEAASALTAAAEREAAREKELKEAEAEAEHWARLACDDLGKNPPTFWKERAEAAEARVTAAEAEREKLRVLLVQAKDRVALNAADLSMHSADYLLVSRICEAIRKETTA